MTRQLNITPIDVQFWLDHGWIAYPKVSGRVGNPKRAEYQAAYRARHREQMAAYQRAYRARHKEQHAQVDSR